MTRPTWNNFIGKTFDDNNAAFEALARLLFKTKYGIGDSLPYFKNHAGNETEPIKVGNEKIGFQAKFFANQKMDYKQIIHSLEKVCERYPEQTQYIIYSNAPIGSPHSGHDMPRGKEEVEKKAGEYGIKLEWILDNDILDLVQANELAYKVFFDPNSNLNHLQKHVDEHNKIKLDVISNFISIGGEHVSLNRSEHIRTISDCVTNKVNLIISGESGSGKSAIVKSYCETLTNSSDYAFFIMDASRLGIDNVNDVFNLTERYDLCDFCLFFSGFTNKFIVIDSAEKLQDTNNPEVARVFMCTLINNGWSLVFTCRTNAAEELSRKIKNDYEIEHQILDIKPETEETIRDFAESNGIKLPQNHKLLEQLKFPFLLARYCELHVTKELSIEDLREEIWNQKVKGDGSKAEKQKREECLLNIVRLSQDYGDYVVPFDKVDIDSASALVHADILSEYLHRGYFVKHDIYADWAWDYIVLRDLFSDSDYTEKLVTGDVSIYYINAFKRWLLNKINEGHDKAIILCAASLEKNTAPTWRKAIFECLGRSYHYAQQWFEENKMGLCADNYKMFNEYIEVLCSSCYQVSMEISIDGIKYPIRRPIGSGWDATVNLIWERADVYYRNNLQRVFRLLSDYSPKIMPDKETAHRAGLLALRIFDKFAALRKEGEHCFLNSRGNDWALLVCNYANVLKEELRSIFVQVKENHWLSHNDPYSELIAYILKADSVHLHNLRLYCIFKKELIALMELFWKEQPDTDEYGWYVHDALHEHYIFGLNDKFVGIMDYYPSSALQTPIYIMLMSEFLMKDKSFEAIDFVVDFINRRVQIYKERSDGYDDVFEVEVELREGDKHKVYMSAALWCLYRGMLHTSHLMESMHMALEKYLLELAKSGSDSDWLNTALWRILENSRSCSLFSIVASIATAYPDVYYEQFLCVSQNIYFHIWDLARYNREIVSNLTEWGLPKYKTFLTERHEANKLAHRQMRMEDILARLQITEWEIGNTDRLCELFSVVDGLKKQVENLTGELKESAEFIILRTDTRAMKIDNVKNNDGIYGTLFTPVPTPQMKEKQEQSLKDSVQATKGISLHAWLDYRYKHEFEKAAKYEYDTNIDMVLSSIREINQQIENGECSQLLIEDEYLPSKACALLLLQFQDQLTDDEKKECQRNVINALLKPDFILSSALSSFEICIAAVPILIGSLPEECGTLQDILVTYVTCKKVYTNYRPCDKIYNMVGKSNLWENDSEFMMGTVEKFKNFIKVGDLTSMTPLQAESLLCLLSSNNHLRDIGKLCIEKTLSLWEPNEKYKYNLSDLSLYTASLIADYILHAPQDEIKCFVSFVKPQINNLDEYFLDTFSIMCAENNLYGNFWRIWNELYDCIINGIREFSDSVINSYLLNPNILRRIPDDWFHLEEKNVYFYIRVANDIGNNQAVVYSIIKVFDTIGRNFLLEIIPTIDKLCHHIEHLDVSRKKVAILHLENMMSRIFREYNNERRTNAKLNNHVIDILASMQNNGSKTAPDLLKSV